MLNPNIYLFVCSLVALAYGLVRLFKTRMPMYFKLIVFAMASQAFSRVFYVITYLCYGGAPEVFNIGYIGFATFLLFIFFANYGQIDNLVDAKTKLITKYRTIPIIVPFVEIFAALSVFTTDHVNLSVRTSFFAIAILAGLAGYFNMKHLIIPDVDNGIVKSIRGFNLLCLITGFLTLMEISLDCFGYSQYIIYVQIILGILYIVLLPVLNKEVKKWTQ